MGCGKPMTQLYEAKDPKKRACDSCREGHLQDLELLRPVTLESSREKSDVLMT